MTTMKRSGALPPLAEGVGKDLRPIHYFSENDKSIFGHGFQPRPPKTIPSLQDQIGCWESDHDFEEALSPAASSTASGPIYERQTGFEFHAQSIRVDKPKNKKVKGEKLVSLSKDGNKKKEALYSKGKAKKVSTPMKERLLPTSFFEEPNKISPILPPISSQHSAEVDLGINVENLSIDHDEASVQKNKIPKCQVFVSSQSDQLTEKLFECVNKETKFSKRKPGKTEFFEASKPRLSGHGDPYLLGNILDKLPPRLKVNERQTLQIISFKRKRDRPVLLPTLAVKNNNLQKLNEIVKLLE